MTVTGRWRVETIAKRAVTGAVTVEFGADGRITGSTGVNQAMGSYEMVDGELRCSPLALTRMSGPPELMDQQNRLLDALTEPTMIQLEGDRLVLGAGDGRLVLHRVTNG